MPWNWQQSNKMSDIVAKRKIQFSCYWNYLSFNNPIITIYHPIFNIFLCQSESNLIKLLCNVIIISLFVQTAWHCSATELNIKFIYLHNGVLMCVYCIGSNIHKITNRRSFITKIQLSSIQSVFHWICLNKEKVLT